MAAILDRVIEAPLPCHLEREIVVVDDGSTDDSAAIVTELAAKYPGMIRLMHSPRNRGKGAAIRTAVQQARGEYTLIQDADLEYNPDDYMPLLQPLVEGVADVVYGSRFASSGRRRVLYYWHAIANHALTSLCNIVADLNLTDMGTGYKAFRTRLLKSIPIGSQGFDIEPELTIKLSKRQARIYEVPISYEGRTYEDGKKIGPADALQMAWAILRYAFTSDLYNDPGGEILDAFSAAPRFNKWLADTVRPFTGRRILEIGAGMGNLTCHLSRRCEHYVATDIDREHLYRLRNTLRHRARLETADCDLTEPVHFQPFANAMDTVVCLNVLEHVKDDLLGLRNIRTALEPGGRVIVLVPHGQELFGELDIALGHFRRYSQELLRERLESSGFQVECVFDFNRISRPGWFFTSRVLRRSHLSRMPLDMFDRLVWLWRRIDRLLPWTGTSIIGVGRKINDHNEGSGANRGSASGSKVS